MDKETRIARIQEKIDSGPNGIGRQDIVWEGSLQPMTVYHMPLSFLVYNKYNGRILTRTKSLEAQGQAIDVETDDGKKLIEDLLWESKLDRNKTTLQDLDKYGQKQVGIITRDGIIIDGNRRAMLLNRSGKYNYFKAIVLPVTLEQNPIEIEKLETSYQMGEDEKLGYNPIEKYLKAQTLRDKGVKVSDIAQWMGESVSEVEKYICTMTLMDEYLEVYKYNKMYTQLDGREDQFLSLEKWTNNFYGEKSSRGFDGYTDIDVDDLKMIGFDYIRANYEGKSFRYLAEGNRDSHLFGDKDIWKEFSSQHFKNIDPINKFADELIYTDVPNLEKTLKARDADFANKTINLLQDNLEHYRERLGNQRYSNEPDKLISKAIDAVKVAQANKNVGHNDVLNKVEELNDITVSIMRKKSPISLLRHINSLLKSVEPDSVGDNNDDIITELKNIQHTAYQLSKDI